jgi:iron complex transport system substrate-binding protein
MFRLPRWRLLVLTFAASLALSACGSSTVKSAKSPPSVVSTAFPVTIAATNGTVVLAHQPSRIVSLSATGTEDLFAVGAGSQVIAVDAFSKYPPGTPVTSLSEDKPNVEAIAGYKPDLVVLSQDENHVVAELNKLSIPVLVEPPAANLDEAYGQIEQLADATGHAAQGTSVVANVRGQIDRIVRATPRPTKPLRVYHELDQTFYSATSHTFIGQIYSLFGFANIADGAKAGGDYPQLSAEYIIGSKPDVIVLADTVCCAQSVKTVASRPGWSNITAVKTGNVVAVDDSIASEWGPRIVGFVQAVSQASGQAQRNGA